MMVEVIFSSGDMKDKRAVVYRDFGKLKVDLYQNFIPIRTEELPDKNESYARSLAENWTLNILK
jgi:hypothetical protein|tara:strand:+ start:1668 stop:1859 length:192 start_codon:yes stop_codon:yes gene_type:complete